MEIIGAGRVGSSLVQRAAAHGLACGLIDRNVGWERLAGPAGAPILVCTRNDDLEGVVQRTPAHRRADLVFIQNGMLHSFLTSRDLQGCTRGILMFAAPERNGSVQAGAPSPFHGPHADAVVGWSLAMGLPAEVLGREGFADVELEKLLWNTVFGLLCDVHDATVGQVVQDHADEVSALTAELAPVARPVVGATVSNAALVQRITDYSLSIPTWRASVKEWAWRNGWFVSASRATGWPTPLHDQLLAAVGRG
jgi:hypothetical protein